MVLAHNIDQNERTEDIKICHDTTFDTMMLSPNILNGLLSAGFYKPSPIQLLGIPLGKLGLDLLLEAKSGTGKTVVFSTIALETIDLNKDLQVIIITPTREIAVQIHDVLKQIGSKCEGLSIEVVIGGLSYQDDIVKMQEKTHILVGSPGRLKYLIKDKHINISSTRLLILDEADKLMDKSFHDDIKYIHSMLPKQKQVIMSSATYPETVMDSINELVQNAQHICPNSSVVLIGVSHRVTYVNFSSNSVRQTELRFVELTKILTETQFKQCVIFCKYQARVTQLHKMLTKAKWPADLVYGKQDQIVRLEALKTLQEYKCRVLISTDLVARGIDAKNVDLVINFEPPENCETYLHRIGRSGRYGSIGMAISIVSEGIEKKNFSDMLKPIAERIELKHFWTGEHIGRNMKVNKFTTKEERELELNKNCSIEKVELSDNFENLWHFIIGKSRELSNFESFQQLCTSYNEKKLKEIETFSDLLKSYKHSEIDKIFEDIESIEYKQMELDKLPSQHYLESVRNFKEKVETGSKNINDKTILGTRDSQDFLNESYPIRNFSNTSPINNSQKRVKETIVCKEKLNENHENKSDNNTHENLKQNKNDTKYIDADAFLLQLPKSLHASTTMQKNCAVKEKNTSKIKSELKHNKLLQKNKSSLEFEYDRSEYSYSKNYKCRNKETCNDYVSVSVNKRIYREYCNNNYVSSKRAYNIWYNKLKSNTKQIEHCLYIEELSKLC